MREPTPRHRLRAVLAPTITIVHLCPKASREGSRRSPAGKPSQRSLPEPARWNKPRAEMAAVRDASGPGELQGSSRTQSSFDALQKGFLEDPEGGTIVHTRSRAGRSMGIVCDPPKKKKKKKKADRTSPQTAARMATGRSHQNESCRLELNDAANDLSILARHDLDRHGCRRLTTLVVRRDELEGMRAIRERVNLEPSLELPVDTNARILWTNHRRVDEPHPSGTLPRGLGELRTRLSGQTWRGWSHEPLRRLWRQGTGRRLRGQRRLLLELGDSGGSSLIGTTFGRGHG